MIEIKIKQGWFDSETNARIETLKAAIGDLYYRMATNDDEKYREQLLIQCNKHRDEMTKLINKALINRKQ